MGKNPVLTVLDYSVRTRSLSGNNNLSDGIEHDENRISNEKSMTAVKRFGYEAER